MISVPLHRLDPDRPESWPRTTKPDKTIGSPHWDWAMKVEKEISARQLNAEDFFVRGSDVDRIGREDLKPYAQKLVAVDMRAYIERIEDKPKDKGPAESTRTLSEALEGFLNTRKPYPRDRQEARE